MELSIIVPVYNGEKHIIECLESIYAQTVSSIELILINDGSTDDSSKKISEFLEDHQGILEQVVFIEQENQGVAASRNTGIQHARGRYVTFIDQDDRIANNYCEKYLEKAENADIVVGGYERITYSGKHLKKVMLEEQPWSKFIVVAPWAHIYRTDFLKEQGLKFLTTGIGEDVYFNLRAYAQTERIITIKDAGYQWMFNEESVSNSKQNTMNEKVDPLFLLDHLMQDISNQQFLENELVEYYFARYACWYMLFSARGSKRSDIADMYQKLSGWLYRYYPSYRKNRFLRLHSPKGEVRTTGWIVTVYYLAERIGILKPLLLLMGCKG